MPDKDCSIAALSQGRRKPLHIATRSDPFEGNEGDPAFPKRIHLDRIGVELARIAFGVGLAVDDLRDARCNNVLGAVVARKGGRVEGASADLEAYARGRQYCRSLGVHVPSKLS